MTTDKCMNLKNLFGKKDQTPVVGADGKSGVAGAVAKLFDKNEKEVAKLRPTVEQIAAKYFGAREP